MEAPMSRNALTEQPVGNVSNVRVERVTIPIIGLGCGGGGSLGLEHALAKVPGVVRAYVNPATEMAYVEYSNAVTNPQKLVASVQAEGFEAGEPGLR